MTGCFVLLVMNVFDDVTVLNPVNIQTDGLKLRGKLTVNKIDKLKKDSFSKKFLSFLYQQFILRSRDVELNPGTLTKYKDLIQHFTEKSTHLKLLSNELSKSPRRNT